MSNKGSQAWARLRDEWATRLEPGEQATVLVWSTFTVTFAGLRAAPDMVRQAAVSVWAATTSTTTTWASHCWRVWQPWVCAEPSGNGAIPRPQLLSAQQMR